MTDIPATTFTPTACGLGWRRDALLPSLPGLATDTTPERVATTALRRVVTLLGGRCGAFFVRDARHETFRLVAVADDTAPVAGRALALVVAVPPRLGSGEAETDMLLMQDDGGDGTEQAPATARARALFVVLRFADEVVGAIAVARGTDAPFDGRDRLLALTVAREAAVAASAIRVA